MKYCSECGTELDEKTQKCPNCGTKTSSNKLMKMIVGALALIGVIAGLVFFIMKNSQPTIVGEWLPVNQNHSVYEVEEVVIDEELNLTITFIEKIEEAKVSVKLLETNEEYISDSNTIEIYGKLTPDYLKDFFPHINEDSISSDNLIENWLFMMYQFELNLNETDKDLFLEHANKYIQTFKKIVQIDENLVSLRFSQQILHELVENEIELYTSFDTEAPSESLATYMMLDFDELIIKDAPTMKVTVKGDDLIEIYIDDVMPEEILLKRVSE